jgi:hypothetical protein
LASPSTRIGFIAPWARSASSNVVPSVTARVFAVWRTRSVSWVPGSTALTVTPLSAISRATVFMKPARPARAVLDSRMNGIGCFTETDVM